jgi:hypothetical protein
MHDDTLVTAGEATDAERALARRIVDEVAERFGTPLYARVDLVPGPDGGPVLIELEAIEPAFYFATSPGAAERFAAAVRASA